MHASRPTRLRNLTIALLTEVQGMSLAEVAAAMGIPPSTARDARADVKAHPELYTGRGA